MDKFLNRILCGDSEVVLEELPDNSIDCVVTDPPYFLKFMGHDWDKALPSVGLWKQALRVLKPGAFAFIMSSPRQDLLSRMIVNLQDAGFETGFTSLFWCYAQGLPKALNISKAVDRKLGGERKVVGKYKLPRLPKDKEWKLKQHDDPSIDHVEPAFTHSKVRNLDITAPATEEAKELHGAYAGFNPKPAVEVIIVAMKPLEEKSYMEQAMKNKKGVTWLESGRFPLKKEDEKDLRVINRNVRQDGDGWGFNDKEPDTPSVLIEEGRFAANILVQDDVLNDGKITKSGQNCIRRQPGSFVEHAWGEADVEQVTYPDEGSFSRYFDLDAWWERRIEELPEEAKKTFPFMIVSKPANSEKNMGLSEKNEHVTVKPLKLMSYLIAIGSRGNDVILDPFVGSGTTAVSAKLLQRKWIGIDKEKKYCRIAEQRIDAVKVQLELF